MTEGKPVIVVEDQKFHQTFVKKKGEIRWRCTNDLSVYKLLSNIGLFIVSYGKEAAISSFYSS